MARTKKTKTTKSTTTSKSKKEKSSRKTRKPQKALEPEPEEVVEEVIEEVVEEEEVEEPTPVAQPEVTRKKRRVVNRETVLAGFDDILTLLEEEVTRRRERSDKKEKSKGVKFLRTLGKKIKTLRNDSARVMKQKPRTKRQTNNSSGFMKPVQISQEMSDFTGWDPDTLRSRVDVTKYICKYIKENDLQNPEDRRQILADKPLARLLKYDRKKDGQPLTYYFLQKKIQPHFLKNQSVSKA
jgi:upstream activation factor subunit UAF30